MFVPIANRQLGNVFCGFISRKSGGINTERLNCSNLHQNGACKDAFAETSALANISPQIYAHLEWMYCWTFHQCRSRMDLLIQ